MPTTLPITGSITNFETYYQRFFRTKADALSFQLLMSILPEAEQEELKTLNQLTVRGRKYIYVIRPSLRTLMLSKRTHLFVAEACLEVTSDFLRVPPWDRVIAEYLLIRSDERLYLKTANWHRAAWVLQPIAALMIAISLAALVFAVLRWFHR